jgi:hypothetical protein
MKINLIEGVTPVGITASILILLLAVSGCALHAKVYTDKNEQCCERLDSRLEAMEEFNRYCMMIVFAARKEKDPKVLEDINRRLNLCKFVFGVPQDQDIMSHLENRTLKDPWRQVYHDFWNPPISCDPREIHCEEF